MRVPTPAARPSRHRRPARWPLTLDTLEPRHLLTTWGPLLTFPTFNQNNLIPNSQIAYNQFAPIDPATGQRSFLGCVAVAETQLAYYWHFPGALTLTPDDRYTSLPATPSALSLDTDAPSADFPNFSAINTALSSLHYDGTPAEQAMLAFAVGILAHENYSSTVSTALLTATTLNRLGFPSATNAFNWSTAKPAVISNIQNHQPVIAQISGASGVHVVLLDGYNDTDNTFHANFGLGGTGDGWYTAPNFAGAGGTFTQIDSLILNISPTYRAPARLKFTQGPTLTVAGQTLSALTVTIQDAHGNTVTNSTAPVTLSLHTGPGGALLAGTLTVQAIQGVAIFTDIQLIKSGNYRLQATTASLTKAVTPTFTITPDLSTQQLFVPALPALTVGKSLSPKVSIVDQFHNLIPLSRAPITLTAADPVIAPITRTTTRGIATFPSLRFTTAANVTLTLNAPAASAQLSVPLTISPGTTLLSKPHPATAYHVGKMITFATTLTSSAPRAIPFTATATLLDQNNQPLDTALVSAAGVARFTFTGLAPGTYTCSIIYPGDSNHLPGTSPTFTLRIFA